MPVLLARTLSKRCRQLRAVRTAAGGTSSSSPSSSSTSSASTARFCLRKGGVGS